jgi:hypothetical protein
MRFVTLGIIGLKTPVLIFHPIIAEGTRKMRLAFGV